MIKPVLCIRLPIQRRILHIYILVPAIEVTRLDCCSLAGEGRLDGDGGEKRGGDEVDVLSRVGEEAHHAEGGKGSHSTGIVVSGKTRHGIVKVPRYILMNECGRKCRTAGVMRQEHGKEGRFVADVR